MARAFGKRLARRTVAGLIRRTLRRDFRRVVWVGGRGPTLPEGRPAVVYLNHHTFQDGYLLWLLTHRVLRRPTVLWMEDWDRAPLFGPLGVLPFPPDDRRQKLATVRETARRLRADPRTLFLYFPEGDLRPPDLGLGPFDAERFERLARLLPPETLWWPAALRLTWWGEDRPTALMAAGEPHEAPDGRERERLEALLARLHDVRPGEGTVLLEGQPSPHERWDLSRLAPLFRRWT